MQNFTITLEESALAWAEIEAKRCNCSVAMLLGQLLKEKMLSEVAKNSLLLMLFLQNNFEIYE